jgi:hypothetical protein
MVGVGAIAPLEDTMKKTAFIALLLIIGMVLVFPKPSHSCGPGWAIGVAAALVGVSLLGATVAPSYGYYGPPAAYAYPPPAYAYPPPAYGYRYPYYGPRYYPRYGYRGYYGGRGYPYRGSYGYQR